MSFGTILREIRKRRGSLRAVADLLDTDFAYLSRLENGKVSFTPSSDFLNRIVEKLDCTPAEKDALFSEARRLDAETEQAVDETYERPALKTLFRSAPKLTESDLKDLNARVENLLKKSRPK